MLVLFTLSSPCVAQGSDKVLLFQSPSLRPGLCAALRLQLIDVAAVVCRDDVAPAALAERLEAARAAVAAQGARLGVLLERDPNPGIVRMVLVGADAEAAVLALERIEDRPSPDVDRSLALKVRHAFEVVSAAEAARAATGVPAPAPAGEPPGVQSALAAVLVEQPVSAMVASAARTRALVEAGAAISYGAQTRGVGLFGLGVRRERARWFAEAALIAELATRAHVRAMAGDVREDEWGLALAGRAARTLGRFSLGAFVEVGGADVHALGITRDGNAGEKRRGLLRTGMGLDLRIWLLHGLALRAAPELTIDPLAQRFDLDQQKVMALGRVRVVVPLTLVLDLAVGRPRRRDAN